MRIGDLELFRSVAERNATVFADDKSQNLIVRLRHNVIRTGLRNISISYSRIALVDVATKLHLDSATAVDDAESIVTKAIRDGGIDASVDHSQGWMQSKETGDIYSTQVWQLKWCVIFHLINVIGTYDIKEIGSAKFWDMDNDDLAGGHSGCHLFFLVGVYSISTKISYFKK